LPTRFNGSVPEAEALEIDLRFPHTDDLAAAKVVCMKMTRRCLKRVRRFDIEITPAIDAFFNVVKAGERRRAVAGACDSSGARPFMQRTTTLR